MSAILAEPERFGMTRAAIDEIYTAQGEMIGTEGRARDQVIKQVIENGWVRIRRYDAMGVRLVVQGAGIDAQISSIPDFLADVLARDPSDGSATVVINDLASGETRTFNVGESGVSETIEGDLSAE
ncbi:MAG TPA: hypothetical protein VJ932_03715 [Alkalispirochaeta sp.]|nr:hypothetical protein [Alkalispirochaeta sp.]